MWVVYIDIDAMRQDHLGCYGYDRNTSPNIDRLAQDGVRFSQCFTSDSPCMPSRAAIISGMYGIKNGVVTHERSGGPLRDQLTSLPWVLRSHNILSTAISSFGRHPAPWFYPGWTESFDPLDRPQMSFQQIDGREVTDRAINWLEDHQDTSDLYLYVQLWDPHAVYEAPASFVELVRNGVYPEHPTIEEFERHQRDDVWHSPRAMGLGTYEQWKNMIDEYDAEIRYADYQVGRILAALEDLAQDRDLLVLLAADHGEEQGEHGVYGEHWSVYNGTQQIPLILRDSRQQHVGTVCDGLTLQLDISATICEAFGIQPPAHWDSQSLFRQLDDPANQRPYLVCGHGLYTAQRAVITQEWKFIRTYHSGLWEIPRVQLFRRDDFWEQDDVSSQYPLVVNELDHYLRTWEEEHRQGLDPMTIDAADEPRGLGYARPWSDRFRMNQQQPMSYVMAERKPDPLT